MASRPVFEVCETAPYFTEKMTEFKFCPGFSQAQKKRCMESLQQAYLLSNPEKKVLEISRASDKPLGDALSAFNLMITPEDGQPYSVECAFQAAKVFENGGPYTDLLHGTSKEAKTDPRIRKSGNIIGFRLCGIDFPSEPKTFFYNWLYHKALYIHPELYSGLTEYDAFTDIMFTPGRSLNCQARSAAVFVSLFRAGTLEEALKSQENYLRIVYGMEKSSNSDKKR